MDNSPTNQLADNQFADRPTRRQLNWPKNQLAEIEIVTKIDVRFFLDTWTCLSGKIAKEKNSRVAAGATAVSRGGATDIKMEQQNWSEWRRHENWGAVGADSLAAD